MEIKQVMVHIEATINLGNYENYKPAITVAAEMTQEEIDDGGILELADMGRKELAAALWDVAEAQLTQYRWDELSEESDYNQRRALDRCAEFRWMAKLNPSAAEQLLTEVVGEYCEKKRAEEAAEAEARAAANAAINAAAEEAALAEAELTQAEGTDGEDIHAELNDEDVQDIFEEETN